MQIFIIVFLFIFGLLFGSFSSVIIERLKFKKKGMLTGRSECPNCKHPLSSFDLFPLFSWLFLRGKCRYCKTPISPIYPLLELTMAVLFALGGYLFADLSVLLTGSVAELAKLGLILFISFVTTIFMFYDIRFTEIPDEILVPAIFIVLALLGVNTFHPLPIFSYFQPFEGVSLLKNPLFDGIAGALFIYSFFYLQILIPGLIYTIKNKKHKLTLEIILGYFLFFWWMLKYLFTWKNEDEEVSEDDMIPTWIGGGDLRIALFMGLLLGLKLSLIGLFASYLVGSVVGVAVLLKNRERGQMIPFGPFLGVGLMITLLWSHELIDLFEKLFLHNF